MPTRKLENTPIIQQFLQKGWLFDKEVTVIVAKNQGHCLNLEEHIKRQSALNARGKDKGKVFVYTKLWKDDKNWKYTKEYYMPPA